MLTERSRNILDFVLGFPVPLLLPQSVAIGCMEFVKHCFLLHPFSDETQAGEIQVGEWVHKSRSLAFASDATSNPHTGAVLLWKENDELRGTEFRQGLPSIQPWGLPIMPCPYCSRSIDVTVTLQHGKVYLRCICRGDNQIKSSMIPQPRFVREGPPNHFTFEFPLQNVAGPAVSWYNAQLVLVQTWEYLNNVYAPPPQ